MQRIRLADGGARSAPAAAEAPGPSPTSTKWSMSSSIQMERSQRVAKPVSNTSAGGAAPGSVKPAPWWLRTSPHFDRVAPSFDSLNVGRLVLPAPGTALDNEPITIQPHTRCPLRQVACLLIAGLAFVACRPTEPELSPVETTAPAEAEVVPYTYPPAPATPSGPVDPGVAAALTKLVDGLTDNVIDLVALDRVVTSKDARHSWLLADLLRFFQESDDERSLVLAVARLGAVDFAPDPAFAKSPWLSITNHLIAWDLPAAPGYRELKGRLFQQIEPRWKPFFADANADIDWRILSWGGVLIDDRPLGTTAACARSCIPALDDPVLTNASGGAWYPDSALVFGVVESGQAVAFPKNIMEVHEMVNITIGGRRFAIPYCTLCGSAQAYYTDSVQGATSPLVLRTSGLLSRSNKVMYDLGTQSVFDTFTGRAVSGPLRQSGVALTETTVVTSTWGEWKQAHADTRIVASDGGIGRAYKPDPLRGRDDKGPIFPIGPHDSRLPVQEKVLGVVLPGAKPVAFSVTQAKAAVAAGRVVKAGNVELVASGGGLRAQLADATEVASHEAFWFAWSQFHPDTILWTPLN